MSKEYKNIIITSVSDLDERMTKMSKDGYEFDRIFSVGKSDVAVFYKDSQDGDYSVRDGMINAMRYMAKNSPTSFIRCVESIRRGENPPCGYGGLSEKSEDPCETTRFSVEAIEAVMRYVRGEGLDMRINDE